MSGFGRWRGSGGPRPGRFTWARGQVAEVYRNQPGAGWGVAQSEPRAYIEVLTQLLANRICPDSKRQRLVATRGANAWWRRAKSLLSCFSTLLEARK